MQHEQNHPYLTGPHPRAFAHRGWHVDDLAGMENSLSAFTRAAREGYRYLETDVHATSDGVVVVNHDDILDRTTDGHGAIGTQTWSVVSQALIGHREPMCRLDHLLEEVPGGLFNIDVKSDQAVEPVLDVLKRTNAWGRVCLASFSDGRLTRLRKQAGPRLLTSMGPQSVLALWAGGRLGLPALSGLARGAAAHVPVKQGPLTVVGPRFLRAGKRIGAEVHVWTVDEPDQMHQLLDLGVDGLVTDRPDLLRDVLRQRGVWAERV